MTSATTYSLWFVNGSGGAGTACVYLDASGVTTNQGAATLLAWMVQGANDGVWVRFDWQVNYWFLWVQSSPERMQRSGPVALGTTIPLTNNSFGLTFGSPSPGTPEVLAIQQDGTIPANGSTLAGIGLHGAGTYALPIGPNKSSQFTPETTPPYRIAFGNLGVAVNDPIDPATFPSQPASVTYPPNVTTMTALLDPQNAWTVSQGAPSVDGVDDLGPRGQRIVVYEAGRGAVSGT